MSYLKDISLTQFRNYTQSRFSFDKKIIAIVGRNGCGKTNLLDSIYYLIFTKSYFQTKEINNIQNGKNGFRIEGQMRSNDQNHQLVIKLADQKKTVSEDELICDKISEYIGKYNAVMIAPEDLKIVLDTAAYRRKFVDGIIAQMNKAYLPHLIQYQKILAQKNAYLKQVATGAMIDYSLLHIYNQELAVNGRELIEQRASLISQLNDRVNRFYKAISDNAEAIEVIYQPSVTAASLEQVVGSSLQDEIQAGRTLYGPHLDEIAFTIAGQPFKTQASQGQKKSLVIALKLSQIDLLFQQGFVPILLLDDIFEKLDEQRLRNFFAVIQSYPFQQLFLTHTARQEVADKLSAHIDDIGFVEVG